MPDRASVLVVAATARELAPADGWRTLECGWGPVEAAAATAAAIAARRPAAILHVGIAGARRDSGLRPASLVIGGEAVYFDPSPELPAVPRSVYPTIELLSAIQRALPETPVVTIGTSARVGGTTAQVEAMEGFAVLRAAQLAAIPAIEVRAIANDIEESDRAKWRLDDAFAAVVSVTPILVDAIVRAVTPVDVARVTGAVAQPAAEP